MGIVPLESPAEMFKKFSPLAEYLSKKLNRRVDLKVAVDFQGAVRDIGAGCHPVLLHDALNLYRSAQTIRG